VNALHEQFIAEARDLIHQATDDLIAGEREGFARERIDRVFRAFHTLKGSAGVVALPAMGLTLHAAEDLLAAIHAGKLDASSAIVDRALSCLDQVARWVDDFEAGGALPPSAGEDARSMAAALRSLLSESGVPEELKKSAQARSATTAEMGLPKWASRLIENHHGRIVGEARESSPELFAFSYEPDSQCFFNGDDPLNLMRKVPRLLAFHVEARETWPPVADLDPFACNLRLQGISAGGHAELAEIFRLVPDQVRLVEVPLEVLRLDQARGAGDDDRAGLIRIVIEEQRQVLQAADQHGDLIGRIGAVSRAAANALRHGGLRDLADAIERANVAALSERNVAPLLSALDQTQASLPSGLAGAASDAAVGSGSADVQVEKTERPASRALRVDEGKIDALVNLAGELIVAKNGISHLAKRLQDELGDRELVRAVRREHDAIERLAGEMHATILQLRMVPVAQVFRSFPRLVRDMSQRLEKKVRLVTNGEMTEADKVIVDRLFEPLLHLVRNALDHGIESPEQRRTAGKAEGATVTIGASRAGDRLIIEVIDDGRGIDPAIVRRRAREREVMGGDELAALTDDQVVDLIFSAGFSTAAEVSDVSGRGVGMDVVRATVEGIGGRTSVISRVGVGTTVRLDLPMNIAMSRIMVVSAGGQIFGIPMDGVTETVRLTPDRISRIKNNDGFVLRDRIVPICSLAELMKLPRARPPGSDARLVVVTDISGKVTALEIDGIDDRLEVVLKPLQGLLSNARGYAGTTLLGDGRVLLVLDLKEILP
jgi:two-component system, chemotaxis family, sensor kinase CheA